MAAHRPALAAFDLGAGGTWVAVGWEERDDKARLRILKGLVGVVHPG